MDVMDNDPQIEADQNRRGIINRFRHPLAAIGAALALVSLANILFLFLIDVFSPRHSPYVGILAYMILPGFLILGLALVPLGMWLARRQRLQQAGVEGPVYPHLDLNEPAQRSTVAFFLAFVVVFVVLSAVGSYRGYEFTDSVQFCGQLCHSVMNPEFTAYQLSPHARVRCVDCHVGAGATWYVRSKLSGARQVYATLFKRFPRPIPTPVENLRPAQETCEQCHWPRKFYGAQLKVITHYGYDEKNTPRQIRLLIKTGGGDPGIGMTAGIHWHMNIANEITYVTADKTREAIPYVRVKDMQGRVTEYMAKDAPLNKEKIDTLPHRRMDCVDCHNRPTHIYVPPDRAVDQSLLSRRIDSSLPYIKQQGVTVLTASYPTTEQAMEGIATAIRNFYASKYPQLENTKQLEIRGAVTELQHLYRTTTFPEMKIDWKTHPDNIGHL
ncbi:MAG TPA: NapC/NirT family cytochrome c, partial [Terriglobales bacterium]|nr:NapC/NirT family cytochrome c [Terriglobales bacterium]